ncbi:hypothetical protein, partial [Serratia marcescens]|uniref:hypothetical protein n=1 Tax=Serratia marcescens TaxID=615 RepID=UPI003D2A60BF
RRVFSCSCDYVDGLGGSINPQKGIKRRSSHSAVNGGRVNGYDNLQSLLSIIAAKMKSMIYQK